MALADDVEVGLPAYVTIQVGSNESMALNTAPHSQSCLPLDMWKMAEVVSRGLPQLRQCKEEVKMNSCPSVSTCCVPGMGDSYIISFNPQMKKRLLVLSQISDV